MFNHALLIPATPAGEWEGVTASFSPEGQPLQLPEYYVPEAYREWGVELFDWQTQCSCQADAQQFKYVEAMLAGLTVVNSSDEQSGMSW